MNKLLTHLVALTFMFALISCTKKREDEGLKVAHITVKAEVKGMDPVLADDRYAGNETSRVYEGLLHYHYLKRPYELEPNLAESMPTVSKDGLTYTFKIREGVVFQDDEAFPNGKGRELVAEDFVYSIKRLADPKNRSTGWWVVDGKIKGLNEWREKASETGVADYSAEIEGVKALDKRTLQFVLTSPYPQFLYATAMPFLFVVAKEAVEKYGKEFINHPVGTGPFVCKDFTPNSNKIVYYRNPTFRDQRYPTEGAPGDKEKGLLEDAGKKLPLLDKLVVHPIVEANPRWLNFQKGKMDWMKIPKDNFSQAITKDKKLSPDMLSKGIILVKSPQLDITYTAFNHDNPLFKNNLKLRQAMSLAFEPTKPVDLFYGGNAIPAQSVIPPGLAGYIEGYKNPYRIYNLEKAKKLLAEAGYPGGKGLPEITYDMPGSTDSRHIGEYFKRSMADIGVKIRLQANTWPELTKKIKTKSTMTHGIAWGADYPDAQNFLQLLYGPHSAPGANGSNYNNPKFNKLYEKAAFMQPGPERTKLYEELYKMAAEEVPWIYGVHRLAYELTQGWLRNYKFMDFDHGNWRYINVDMKAKEKMLKEKF